MSTAFTINLATLGGAPAAAPTFAVTLAFIVLYDAELSKSTIFTFGGLVKSYPSPPAVTCID